MKKIRDREEITRRPRCSHRLENENKKELVEKKVKKNRGREEE